MNIFIMRKRNIFLAFVIFMFLILSCGDFLSEKTIETNATPITNKVIVLDARTRFA